MTYSQSSHAAYVADPHYPTSSLGEEFPGGEDTTRLIPATSRHFVVCSHHHHPSVLPHSMKLTYFRKIQFTYFRKIQQKFTYFRKVYKKFYLFQKIYQFFSYFRKIYQKNIRISGKFIKIFSLISGKFIKNGIDHQQCIVDQN